MADESVHIEEIDASSQMIEGCNPKPTGPCLLRFAPAILPRKSREPTESVKSYNSALMVRRFQDGTELGPRHQSSSTQYATFDDRTLNSNYTFENFVAYQEIG
jgi:hypothetical protein